MAPVYRHLRLMVYLMAAGPTRGFAGALAEVSVEAGEEAAAEADLAIGGRFELASNTGKDGYHAKR
jgi:hypothetical protein